jgi:hypothetical protein
MKTYWGVVYTLQSPHTKGDHHDDREELTDKLRGTVPLEKLIVAQFVKDFPKVHYRLHNSPSLVPTL